MVLRIFGWSFAVSAAALVTAFLYGGMTAFVLVLILGILEVSLSFDNAVVNATVLERMNRIAKRWLPPARVKHPFPNVRFDARTRGRSPVR